METCIRLYTKYWFLKCISHTKLLVKSTPVHSVVHWIPSIKTNNLKYNPILCTCSLSISVRSSCSNYVKSGSWCRLSRAHNWSGEALGGWVLGRGRDWGGEGQFMSNLGPGWTRIAPRKEEGYQVSKRARGISKGLRLGLIIIIISLRFSWKNDSKR